MPTDHVGLVINQSRFPLFDKWWRPTNHTWG